jgi:hypothetical protein
VNALWLAGAAIVVLGAGFTVGWWLGRDPHPWENTE